MKLTSSKLVSLVEGLPLKRQIDLSSLKRGSKVRFYDLFDNETEAAITDFDEKHGEMIFTYSTPEGNQWNYGHNITAVLP